MYVTKRLLVKEIMHLILPYVCSLAAPLYRILSYRLHRLCELMIEEVITWVYRQETLHPFFLCVCPEALTLADMGSLICPGQHHQFRNVQS
jgi:hypothetical protein